MLTDTKTERIPLQVGWAMPAGWAAAPSGPVCTRWEYLSLHTDGDAETVAAVQGSAPQIDGASVTEALEALGAEDWELVSVAPRGSSGFLYVFKRPVMKR